MTLRGWEAKSLVDEQDEGEQFLGKHQFQHQSKAPFGVGSYIFWRIFFWFFIKQGPGGENHIMMGINEWVGELTDDAKKSFRMNKMLWEHDLIKKRVTCASTQKMMISWMLYHYMLQVVFIRKVLQKILP